MPRGQPDFGALQVKTTGATLADMADLAVRLGSIVEYDRRGDIVCIDDFEAPVIRWLDNAGGGQTVTLSSTSFKSGSQALKLHNIAAAGLGVGIARSFKKQGTPRLGIEISFSNPPDTSYLDIHLTHYDGAIRYLAWVQINFSTEEIKVRLHGDTWQVIETALDLFEENFCFTPVKLVMDFEASKYVRLLVGEIEYDISAYTIPWIAGEVTPRELVYFDLGNDATATAADIYLDGFILTQNEP